MIKITNDHRWTSRTLRKQEWKIKNVALRQRVMAVRLVMEGYLGKDVAAMLHLCRQSVAFYVSLFNEGGLDLLLDWKSPLGREPFLTPEQQQVHSVGTSLLPSYIREHYGVAMSRERIRKLLHRMRRSWNRPTYTLDKGDAEQQQAFEKQMDLIKKNLITLDKVLLYVDKTLVHSYQILRTTWSEVGGRNRYPRMVIIPMFRSLEPSMCSTETPFFNGWPQCDNVLGFLENPKKS